MLKETGRGDPSASSQEVRHWGLPTGQLGTLETVGRAGDVGAAAWSAGRAC